MEKRGADVVSYDLSDDTPGTSSLRAVRPRVVRHRSPRAPAEAEQQPGGSRTALTVSTKVVYGTVYEIPEEIGRVDVATFGNVLRHVRDPFLALEKALRLTTETAIVTENPSLRYSLPQMMMRAC